jgi:hypothetical protein
MKKRIFKHATQTGVKLLFSLLALLLVLTGCNVPTPPQEELPTGTEQPTDAPTEQPTELPTEQPTEVETEDETENTTNIGQTFVSFGFTPTAFLQFLEEYLPCAKKNFIIPIFPGDESVVEAPIYLFRCITPLEEWVANGCNMAYDFRAASVLLTFYADIPKLDGEKKLKVPVEIYISDVSSKSMQYQQASEVLFVEDPANSVYSVPWEDARYMYLTVMDEGTIPENGLKVYFPDALTDQQIQYLLDMIKEHLVYYSKEG